MWLLLLIVFQGSFSTTTLLGEFATEAECQEARDVFILEHRLDYPETPLAKEPVCIKQ